MRMRCEGFARRAAEPDWRWTLPYGIFVHRSMEIQFTIQILKEGRTFVAHTPELDVSSCGGSMAKGFENLKASSFTSGWGSSAMTRGVMSPEGSRSVAKLRSGTSLASKKVLSTTSPGVLPTKITLPPALAKA